MPSFQQKLCNGIARAIQKPTLAFVRPVWLLRIVANQTAKLAPKPKGLRTKTILTRADGTALLTEIRTDASPERAKGTLLYIHGGGFVIGSLPLYRHLVATIADAAGLRAMFVDYRMAPEHPAPAALNDVTQAYHALADTPEGRHIAIAGDSAGGNLALALILRLKRARSTLPFATVCLSPVTDLRGGNPSFTANAGTERLLPSKWVRKSAASYIKDADPSDPELSPILGDFADAPPTLIHVDTGEILYDDARLMADHLRGQGVDVTYTEETGLFHVWHLNVSRSPEADASAAQISAFLSAQLDSATSDA